jgi:hypothetical protein
MVPRAFTGTVAAPRRFKLNTFGGWLTRTLLFGVNGTDRVADVGQDLYLRLRRHLLSPVLHTPELLTKRREQYSTRLL